MSWGFKSVKCPDPQHLLWHELQHPDTRAGIPRKGGENISSIDRQESSPVRRRIQENTPELQEPCRVCLSLSVTCSHTSLQFKPSSAHFQAINSDQQFDSGSSEIHIPIPFSNYELSLHVNLLKLVFHINTQARSHTSGWEIPGLSAC